MFDVIYFWGDILKIIDFLGDILEILFFRVDILEIIYLGGQYFGDNIVGVIF